MNVQVKAQKPLKMFITELFGNGELLDSKGIHELVSDFYPGEKYCSLSCIEEHLKSLKAVGILHEEGSYLDDVDNIVSVYRISEYGLDKLHKAQW